MDTKEEITDKQKQSSVSPTILIIGILLVLAIAVAAIIKFQGKSKYLYRSDDIHQLFYSVNELDLNRSPYLKESIESSKKESKAKRATATKVVSKIEDDYIFTRQRESFLNLTELKPITAKSGLKSAKAQAKIWDSSAKLVHVSIGDLMLRPNGKQVPISWIYIFASDNKYGKWLGVLVGSIGVIDVGEGFVYSSQRSKLAKLPEITNWSIDSDEGEQLKFVASCGTDLFCTNINGIPKTIWRGHSWVNCLYINAKTGEIEGDKSDDSPCEDASTRNSIFGLD